MILSFINQKGGVGKTTSVFNLSYILLEKGYNVLAIDLDPQGNLTDGFDINPLEVKTGVYEVLLKNENILNGLVEVKSENEKTLYTLPTNLNLVMAENEISGRMARELILKNTLKTIEDNFDFILIDCPPSLSNLSTNAIVASDYIIIPCQTDYMAYKGLELLLDNIKFIKNSFNSNLEVMGVISTFKEHTKHSDEIQEIISQDNNILGIIPRAVIVKDSYTKNLPIFEVDKNHKSNLEYKKVAEKIIGKL